MYTLLDACVNSTIRRFIVEPLTVTGRIHLNVKVLDLGNDGDGDDLHSLIN